MARLRAYWLIVLVVLILVAAGCSSKPVEQIQSAEKAMDQAKEQHAAEFAPDEWKQGQEAWDEAQSGIEKGNYSQASARLLKAKGRFERARDIAKGRRDALLREVQDLQKTIDLRYQTAKTNMQAAKLPAQTKKDLEATCAEIDKAIERIKAEVKDGEYTQARMTAQTTMRQVYDIEKEVKAPGGKKS